MVNATFTITATADCTLSSDGTFFAPRLTAFAACSTPMALLRARSYPPGAAICPDDLAVVAELVDAQR